MQHLIAIENPNRVVKKNKKLADVDSATSGASGGSNLSRRERWVLEDFCGDKFLKLIYKMLINLSK